MVRSIFGRCVCLGFVLVAAISLLMVTSYGQEKKAEAKKEEKKAEEAKKVEEKKDEKKEPSPADQAKRMREASEKLRLAMEKASEEYRRAMDKAHADYRAEMDKVRAEGAPPRVRPGAFGRPLPGKLGLIVSPVLPLVADQLGFDKDKGLMIVNVMADGPAGKAGLKEHDILVSLDGKAVTSRIQDLEKILADIKPKTPIDAEIYRRGKKETIKGIELPDTPPRLGAR